MRNDLEFAAQRFSVFADLVLEPAVHPAVSPLTVGVFQGPEPISYTEATRQSYRPVEVGWRWGPVWSSAWYVRTVRHRTSEDPDAYRGSSISRAVATAVHENKKELRHRRCAP